MSSTIPLAPAGSPAASRTWRLPGPGIRPTAAVARWLRGACVVLGWFLVAGIAGLALYGFVHGERVYEGVSVGGVRVGGMTETRAVGVLQERAERYAATPLRLTAGDRVFEATPQQLGVSLDAEASAAIAFAHGRDGSLWDRSQVWARGLLHGGELPAVVWVDQVTLEAYLRGIAPEIVFNPSDAYLRMNPGGDPEIVPEADGMSLDLTTSAARIGERIARFTTEPIALATNVAPPAVTAAGLALGLDDARAAVDAPLTVVAGERRWTVSADELKRVVSVTGNDGTLTIAREPLAALVATVAGDLDVAGRDAAIVVDSTSALAVEPSTDSTVVDRESTLDGIVAALRAGGDEATVAMTVRPPAISDDQAAAGVKKAEALIADGLNLTWDGGDGRLERVDLLAALTITPRPGDPEGFGFDLDRAVLEDQLTLIAEQFDRPAKDATFRLLDGNVQLAENAEDGRALNVAGGLNSVVDAVFGDVGSVKLRVETLKPEFTSADRKRIAVPDLLADSAIFYGDSSEPRAQNVERAVQLQNGWLVPPGGVYSYVEHMGKVDVANGFATGFGIVADEVNGGVTTAPVIGGGICQVSTTIFQAAFWAGLPTVERWEHPYWLPRYGSAPRGMTGLDAMVNIEDDWALDLKFENTTGNWIAVLVYADGVDVSAQILGTDPGWEISIDEPVISNVVPIDPQMYYTSSPELPQGQESQVETAQEGFDVAISRTVTGKDGVVVLQDSLISSFAPARNMTLRGTGGEDPPAAVEMTE